MNTLNQILLQAGGGAGGGSMSGILMIVAMIVIFYFFMIRPQQKKQKEIKRQREAMQKGDKVMTAGGIHGRIVAVEPEASYMIIEVAPNVTIRVEKAQLYPLEAPAKAAAKEEKKK